VKIIWLTDLHFNLREPVLGVNTAACLDAALRHINEHYANADLCVLSGDLVDKEEPEDYAALRSRLDTLPMPWFPLPGNHDNRGQFRQSLVLPENSMQSFIQYVVPTPTHDLICLDTLREGSAGGEICEERLAWLVAQIEAAGDKPVCLFMHHPPMTLDLPMQDQDSFYDREKFLSFLTAHSNVKYIFAGHVHRAVSGQVGGIGYTTMRSLSIQAPPPVPAWTWDTFEAASEAPNYGVVSLRKDTVNVQFIEFG
jgi:3',5'-cyclic AMP phosphodiesterase CpdA